MIDRQRRAFLAIIHTNSNTNYNRRLVHRLRASAWQPGDWGFIPGRVTIKTLQIVFAAFAPGAQHKQKCERFCVCVVRHVMFLNSVQSFVIVNCNGPTIENGLNKCVLAPAVPYLYL